jgi:hypothetical protein
MTSANVFYLSVYDKDEKRVGLHRYNMLTEFNYNNLLVHTPHKEHTVLSWGYDEEEEVWEDEIMNLEEFLKKTKTI